MIVVNDMYYFPHRTASVVDTHSREEENTRSGSTGEDKFLATAASVDELMAETTDLMLKHNGGRGSLSSSASTDDVRGRCMPALMDVEAEVGAHHKDHLDKRYVQLCKTTKLAEKVRDQTLQVRLWSDRSNKALAQLTDTMETAELLCMDVGFVLKFGKEKNGKKLVSAEYTSYSEKCDDMVDGLVADVKGLRLHLVPDKKMP